MSLVQILTTPLWPYGCRIKLFLMVLMSKCSDSLNCGPSLSQKSRVGHAGLPCWPGGRGGRPAVVPVVQSPEAAALSGPWLIAIPRLQIFRLSPLSGSAAPQGLRAMTARSKLRRQKKELQVEAAPSFCPFAPADSFLVAKVSIGELRRCGDIAMRFTWKADSSSLRDFLKLYNRQERFRQKDSGHSKPFQIGKGHFF